MPDAGASIAMYPLVQVINGSTYNAFLNGQKSSGVAVGSLVGATGGLAAFSVAGVSFMQGITPLVALFNRVLHDEEALSLLKNPWQIFRPSPRTIYSFSAASTGTLKTSRGVARASIKTLNGIAIASVKTYDALTP